LIGFGAALMTSCSKSRLPADEPVKLPTIDEWIRQRAADAPLAMRFHGRTAADCRQWQAAFVAQLRSLLGPHTPPAQWKTVVQNSADLDDHCREELLLSAAGAPPLPVYLLLPKKAGRRRPGVLACTATAPTATTRSPGVTTSPAWPRPSRTRTTTTAANWCDAATSLRHPA
jgi:hypothetical protein